MNIRNCFCGLTSILLLVPAVLAATQTGKVHNDKVLVVEHTLAPGEAMSLSVDRPVAVVYLDDGRIEVGKKPRTEAVRRGQTAFQPPQTSAMKNSGSSELRIVSVEYLGKGGSESWGTAGLAPDYKLLFENQYGRVYDIRIAAGKSEPLHSHHDRVVICLSGAELEHEMPDGRKETSSLKTGEMAWRHAAIHVGHNLGKTDLWVIAIEPK